MLESSERLSPASPDASESAADAIPDEWVSNLVRGLAQTLRARQIYNVDNPVFQRFVSSLRGGFAEIWQRTDALTLDVEEDVILWRGGTVYRAESRTESLSFLFFKEGVRELTFSRGFEAAELEPFVELLHRARNLRPTDEDDLLTLLWSQSFSHFHHASVDLFAEGLELPEPEKPPLRVSASRIVQEEVQPLEEAGDAVEAAQRELRETEPSIRPEQFDATLYFLDAGELGRLREEIGREMGRDLRRSVLGALFDALEESGARQQEEIVEILGMLLPHLLGHAELNLAAEVVGELKAIAAKEDVLAEQPRQRVNVLLNELSTPSAIDELMRAVESGAIAPSAEELAAFLRHLREGALGPLIRATAGIRQEELRSVVESAVERIAAEHGSALIEQLRARDPVVAEGAARLVGRLQVASAARDLGPLAVRPEPAVRLAAVEAAASLRSPDAVRVLMDALHDGDRQVRISAARGLAALRYQPAGEVLRALIEGREMREADLTEKLAIFEAYGALNIPESISILDRMLNGRSLLGRREPSELRACAAVALGRSKLPAARKALEKAERDDDPIVRTAVSRVLREEG